jgi:YD repeat-containing protein
VQKNKKMTDSITNGHENGGASLPSPLASLKYFYSKDGNISAREVNGVLQKYEYDLRGQLVAVKEKVACDLRAQKADASWRIVEQYVYDPNAPQLKQLSPFWEKSFRKLFRAKSCLPSPLRIF